MIWMVVKKTPYVHKYFFPEALLYTYNLHKSISKKLDVHNKLQ